MKDCNCIFCKIANGEIPSATIYENEDFRVILDISPASRGHALILPKEHYENLFVLPKECVSKAFVLAQAVSKKLEKLLGCDGINVIQNNGEAAGQTVFHFHIHLIPRYTGDKIGLTWKPGVLKDSDKEEIVKKFTEMD